ncbi:unnamed protein product [Amoebophrya sp. A120]|nr:unnamed protein product [Amoebophrya sp. A120]|eukprot:GSA120T00009568001.1
MAKSSRRPVHASVLAAIPSAILLYQAAILPAETHAFYVDSASWRSAGGSLFSVHHGDTLNIILRQLNVTEEQEKHDREQEEENRKADRNILRKKNQTNSTSSKTSHGKKQTSFPEQWFPQVFDHFASSSSSSSSQTSKNDTSTWPQRFFENDQHFQPNGPVFLMIGGEGEISDAYVSDRFLAAYFAKQFNGSVLALEHRFYGKSQPFNGDLSDLQLLSSQQALADLVGFVRAQKDGRVDGLGGEQEQKEDSSLVRTERNKSSSTETLTAKYANSKFICLGGSYPGNLAAWFRQKYPDVVHGCLSFSAPVFAKKDFYEYGQMVYKALDVSRLEAGDVAAPDTTATTIERTGREQIEKKRASKSSSSTAPTPSSAASATSRAASASTARDVSAKLLQGYEAILTELKTGTPKATERIRKKLNACPFTILSDADIANVESILTGVTAGVVQYNNTLPEGRKISDVRKLIEKAETPEAAAWGVFEQFSEYFLASLAKVSRIGRSANAVVRGGEREKILLKKAAPTSRRSGASRRSVRSLPSSPTIASLNSTTKYTRNNITNNDTATNVTNRTSSTSAQHKGRTRSEKHAEQDSCVDYSQRIEYTSLVPDSAAAARSWVYQTCNEFGYFQTSRVSLHNKTMYTSGVSDPSLWDGICENVFGIYDTETRIANTRSYYDIEEIPDRTVFINGALDPWSTLSRKPNGEKTSYLVPHGSHCVGLYGHPGDDKVMPAAQELQLELEKTVKGWLFGGEKDEEEEEQEVFN